ncbi:S-layer homology domain-containing protein [Bhargavaea ullalensis]|uniref:Uncharacterized protein YjdB n=1 Tax=Bhargavaea ullalensis TaxID=1265685 RepID=A0ABV2GAV0_9BACL
MKTNRHNKLAVATATTAMVASAVVPVAAAPADNSDSPFTDVPKTSSHFDNIVRANELGIMTGYDDKSFKPNKLLNRGDVTKALGKFVVAQSGMTRDEYVKSKNINAVENFTDVPDNSRDPELVVYSKIVKEAKIFEGSNNNLMATRLIKRDQMAEVLVRAFGFEDKEGDTVIKDAGDSAYAKSIEILYENGITDQNPYRPLSSTSRAQFATFLVRSYDATVDETVEVTSVEGSDSAVDRTAEQAQFAAFTVNGGKKMSPEQLKEAGYEIEFLSTSPGIFKDKETGELDQEKLETAPNKIVYQVKITKGDQTFTSADATLTLQDFKTTVASLDQYELLMEQNKVANNTLVSNESAKITNIKGKSKSGEELTVTEGLTYSSSDNGVVLVGKDGTVQPVKAGKATITVTHKDSGATLDVPITVSAEARAAGNAAAEIKNLGLIAGQTRSFNFDVTDQYGMPFAGFTQNDTEIKNSDGQVIGSVSVEEGKEKGSYVATVTAKNNAGSGTIQIKATDKNLLSIPLTVGTDRDVASRKLELADGQSDANLDLSPVQKDQSLTLAFNEYNKDGLYIGQSQEVGQNGKYQAKSNNDNVEVSYQGNDIVVTAKKAGKATITIYQGDVPRENFAVTVEDTTPSIQSVNFKTDIITKTPVMLSDLLSTEGVILSSDADVSVAMINEKPTIYVDVDGTEAAGYTEGDLILGTVEAVSADSGLADLKFVENAEGDIELTGLKDGDEGTFAIRVMNGTNVLGSQTVTVDLKNEDTTPAS